MNKILQTVAFCATSALATAGSLSLNDDSFSFRVDGVALSTASLFEVRWGTVTGGVFSPLGGLENVAFNGAYMDVATPELVGVFEAGDNSLVTAGTPLALSLSILPDDSSYATANALNQVVLLDPLWIAPTFTLLTPELSFTFSNNTTVAQLTGILAGTGFQFNGGNEIIDLATTVIPEPSSFAAIAGLAVVGMAASRRRRSA